LVNQDVARNLTPTEAFVVPTHAINTKKQREIDFPLIAEKGCCVFYKASSMAAPLERWNRHDGGETTNQHVSPIRASAVFQNGGMTNWTVFDV
jgi:hypothetical protein